MIELRGNKGLRGARSIRRVLVVRGLATTTALRNRVGFRGPGW
jgi:hypothetical protein